MNHLITIDTGTSNTRIHLLDANGCLLQQYRSPVGVKNTAADGNNHRLKQTIREGLRSVMEKAGIQLKDVDRILASGMITSDMGLWELPHINAPAGIKEFAAGTKEVLLDDICEKPITFIPGLKNRVPSLDLAHFGELDMIRGEETEALALLENLSDQSSFLLILPGSHTEFISVGPGRRLLGCLTTISGEMIDAITNHTLISSSLHKEFPKVYDRDAVLLGSGTSAETGLTRAIFSTRILEQFITKDTNFLSNYLMGAILQNDVQAICHSGLLETSKSTSVLIAGKSPLKEALVDLFSAAGCFASVCTFQSPYEHMLSARGAYLICQELGTHR